MLNFVSSYLRNQLSFNPLGKVLNGDDEVFHLTYDQREKAQMYIPHVWKGHGL